MKLYPEKKEKENLIYGTGSELYLIWGEDVSEDDASAAAAIFAEKLPNAENMLVDGGQPVYMYMISAE